MGKNILTDSAVHHGLNIAYFRNKRKWTQGDLAKKSGFTQREISKHEHQHPIGDDILQKYADVFNVDIYYLRDVASYTEPGDYYAFAYDHAQINGLRDTKITHPLEAVREIYEANIARLIEANNKHTYTLEKQIEELKAELKTR